MARALAMTTAATTTTMANRMNGRPSAAAEANGRPRPRRTPNIHTAASAERRPALQRSSQQGRPGAPAERARVCLRDRRL
eukprot:6147287-Pyramimonas_sp.AAC.1